MRGCRGLLLVVAAAAYAGVMVGVDRVEWYHPGADSVRISDDVSVGGYIGIWLFVSSLTIGYLIERPWALLLALVIPLDHWLIANGEPMDIYGYSPLKLEAVAREWTYIAAFIGMGLFVHRHERMARRRRIGT